MPGRSASSPPCPCVSSPRPRPLITAVPPTAGPHTEPRAIGAGGGRGTLSQKRACESPASPGSGCLLSSPAGRPPGLGLGHRARGHSSATSEPTGPHGAPGVATGWPVSGPRLPLHGLRWARGQRREAPLGGSVWEPWGQRQGSSPAGEGGGGGCQAGRLGVTEATAPRAGASQVAPGQVVPRRPGSGWEGQLGHPTSLAVPATALDLHEGTRWGCWGPKATRHLEA